MQVSASSEAHEKLRQIGYPDQARVNPPKSARPTARSAACARVCHQRLDQPVYVVSAGLHVGLDPAAS